MTAKLKIQPSNCTQCIHELFEWQVEKSPDAIAVTQEDENVTYFELNRRANQLARYLREVGVGPNGRVAICMERGVQVMVAFLATLKAGGAYVPLDPAYAGERLAYMLEDSAPVVLLTHGAAPAISTTVPTVDLDADGSRWSSRSGYDLERHCVGVDAHSLAYVIYTSGSTGVPKGVMVEHCSLVNLIHWHHDVFHLRPGDMCSCVAGLGFDASGCEIWPTLCGGANLLFPTADTARNPELLMAWWQNQPITVGALPTPMAEFAFARRINHTSLRVLLTGGDRVQRPVPDWVTFPVVNNYGPTETTVLATSGRLSPLEKVIHIGGPIRNTQIYILDGNLQEVPEGESGEVYIGGAGVARGYLNRPDLTAERFQSDPFGGGGARMYQTGDLGRWLPGGKIEFLGRNDFQVKIRGYRIELGEIEAALAKHPDVRENVVIAHEDSDGGKRLVAYYTGEGLSAEALRAHLSSVLPEYMVPAAYVRLEAMPLTANGKFDRKGLPAPEADAYASSDYEPPVGETETRLARIWAEALRVEWVGRNDNFFQLGGHSLLAVTVIERMRSEGIETSVHTLFTAPTLRAVAEPIAGTITGARDGHIEIPPNGIPAGCAAITPEILPLVELTQAEIDSIAAAAPGGVANIQDIYPLAPLQEGILFHHLMSRRGDVYLSQSLLAFPTRELLDGFAEALRVVIARHDILRTAVMWEGLSEPVQVVWREAPLIVEETALDPSKGEAAGQLRERFDPRRIRLEVRQAPLMRCIAAEDPREGRWLMLWLTHHLVIDQVTVEIMAREAQAQLLGEADRLQEPLPFRNFVAQTRLGMGKDEHEAFFRKMLGDVDEPTAPFGLLEAQGDGSGIEEARMELEPGLAERLRTRARGLGVSVASVCHLAWALLLARVSGRDDVVFGTVLVGRMESGPGAERTLGLFINTLPVRVAVGAESVVDSVRRTHAQLAELMRHEHASLALAQRCSAVAAPAPLFSSLLNYQHGFRGAEQSLKGALSAVGIEMLVSEERTNYPLTLSVDDLGDGFSLTAQAANPIGPGRICEFMRTVLEKLVEALERTPEAETRAIGTLPEAEWRKVGVEWNSTASEYAKERCVHELVEWQVEWRPDAVALTQEDESVTYAELNSRANQLAHYLRELGVGPDRRVALCMERGFDVVVALLATLKAGGAYVPLDPAYAGERLAYMLEDSAPVALLTHTAAREALKGISTAVPIVDLDADQARWSSRSGRNLERRYSGADASSLAYVIYTSGSTGAPKGVMVEHCSLVNLIDWHCKSFDLKASDRASCVAGLGFDASAWEIWPALCVGANLLLPSAEAARNPELLMDWWRDQPIDVSFLPTPTAELAWARGVNHKSLRTLLVGGDRLRRMPASAAYALVNNYGPTECTVVATSGRLSATEKVLHIGRPIGNTQIYILDRNLRPVPQGVAGELYVGGAGVARGYLNRADMTAERFQSDPFGGGARMYKTGDLGRWMPDGKIEFLGRNDFQVKIRGFRIELGEIEAVMAKHPQVRETVVIAHEDSDGGKRLMAYYTGEELAAETLRAHVRAALPEYMVPSAYVRLEAMPLTPNGKLDRRALPTPGEEAYASRAYEAPVGAVEMQLARIWAEVLKVERVGRNDNFFELGGHSLLGVALIERLRREGLALDVRTLFATPTLQALAEAVMGGSEGQVSIPANEIQAECRTITPEMLPLVELTQVEIDSIVAGVPGGAGNVQDIYPLAPLQEGILFHHLMSGEGDAYLLQALLSFDTRVRLDGFVEALRAVIARHDILRTAVVWEGLPEPVQVVWREAPLLVEEVELAEGDAENQLRERFDPRRTRLDVRRAPLVRCVAARNGERWLLLWLSHHLAIDHVTLENMVLEAQAHLSGETDELPEPVPFRNFVAQARLGMKQEEHEAFFREMLGDVEEPTAPFGLVEAQGDGSGIEEARIELDAALAEELGKRARAVGVSVASLCHVAWAQVLARVSGREDVVFGTVLLGRMQSGMGAAGALGLFINTLPVRIGVGQESVERSVRRTHDLLAKLMKHEHASLALAQRCSGVAAPAPLFSGLLNYRHSRRDTEQSLEGALAWAGIEVSGAEERSNYPLTMSVDDLGNGFALTAQAAGAIGAGRICAFMERALEGLVEALEKAPETEARAIDVLPEGERRQVVVEWNATDAEYPKEQCIHELFEKQAETNPDAIAVVQEEKSLSYGELNGRANGLAQRLRGMGVGPDTRVAICMERSVEMVIALLATLKAGGAYVPLDPAYPVERLAYMLKDSAPVVLLADATGRAATASVSGQIKVLELTADAAQWPESGMADVPLSSEYAAYVIYTSGSTGAPKGVMVSHRNLVASTCARLALYGKYERFLLLSSIAFDSSVAGVVGTLACGGTLCILSQGERTLEPGVLASAIGHWGITSLLCVPSLLQVMLEHLRGPAGATLRQIIVAGEACPPALVERVGETQPQAALFNEYGPTENTVWATAHICPAGSGDLMVPIGRPIENTKIYILDGQNRPAPVGVAGEIFIGGAGVANGYLNRPDLTAERFTVDAYGAEPSRRLYRTGDVGRWRSDGAIDFLGRNDFQVKIRGFRIELGEIEAAIAGHADVRDAVVIVGEDGEGGKRLVAYYTGEEMTAETLRAHVRAGLPEYMVPSAFVWLEAMPLTPNGKLDRRALPAPGDQAYVSRHYEAPVGTVEAQLARIWAGLLKVERVGRNDNFFELGGHSLLGVALIERMRREGLALDVRTLFAAPTVRALAEAVAGGSEGPIEVPANRVPDGCRAITPEMLSLVELTQAEIDSVVDTVPGGAGNVQDIYPLAPLQEGILFHHMMGGEGDAYLSRSLLAFGDRARLDGFIEAMRAVIARHDILRTAVVWEGLPEPVQVVWREAALSVEEVEPDSLEGDAEIQLRERFDPRRMRLDVREAPLVRCAIARDAARERWLLLWLSHHLAVDHVTLENMVLEAQAHLAGEMGRLPEPVPFRNFVAQARLGMKKEEHEAFFREMLGDVEEPTAPFGLVEAQGDGSGIEETRIELEAALAEELGKRARAAGVSVASLCHVAWAQVLARVSGREDVVFGTVLLGRMQSGMGAAGALGLFINTLPVRIRVGQEGVERSVRRTHELLARLMKHEHASLALAQRCSGVAAPAPLFSALLNYRHSRRDTEQSLEGALAWAGIEILSAEERTNYPLTMSVDDLGNGFALTARTVASIEPARICAFMRKALQGLVEALEKAPETEARAIDVLPQGERRQVVVEWNATESEYPRQECVHELFGLQAERTPDAIAVVCEEESLSYGELNRRANGLARRLLGMGVGPDTRVAICMERSLEMVIALMATLKAGGAYVPLDPGYPVDRLAYMLKDSAPAVLLTHDAAQAALAGQRPGVPTLNLDSDAPEWAGGDEQNPAWTGRPNAGNLAYIIYTSGSTGLPKGAMNEHGALVNRMYGMQRVYELGARDAVLQKTPFSFDVSVWEFFWPLSFGARLVMAVPNGHKDPAYLARTIREEGITTMHFVPSMLRAFLEHDEVSECQSLARVLCGGESLAEAQANRFFELLPGTDLYNMYGPAETAIDVTAWNCRDGACGVGMPIGRPLVNTSIYVLDGEGRPAPVGVTGEIYIAGVQVGRGYLDRAQMTAERFRPNPFSAQGGERIYKTGDLGRWLPEGKIEFLGRNDFQVKIRGFRIELGEIEAALAGHQQVREAAVVAREDGRGGKQLVAYYTGEDLGAETLRSHLLWTLPEYMTPSSYVHLETLPLNPNGKLDRRALPSPELDSYLTRGYEPPVGETETELARIWMDVLKVERVGRRDNFFELGGHSLLATMLIVRIKREIAVDINLADVFEFPELTSLAECIVDAQLAEFDPGELEQLAAMHGVS